MIKKQKLLQFLITLSVLFFVLPNISYGAELNPRNIEHIEGVLEFGGEISSPLRVEELNYSFYGIPDNYYSLEASSDYSIGSDEYGNRKLILEHKDVLDKEFHVEMKVESDSEFAFPKDVEYPYNPPKKVVKYLEDGTKTVISEDIKKTSRMLVENTLSSFEAISNLAHWVNRKLVYDKRYGEITKSSDWIFKNRRGTCDEFSTLLISMLRSSGIPARYVAGAVYSKGGWGYHGWVEAYLGKWVPIDPTWEEVGWIDATHIPFGRFKDPSEVDVGIEYRSFRNIGNSINFEAPQVDVNVFNKELGNKVLNLRSSSYPEGIPSGKSSVITLKIENEGPGCVFTTLHLLPRKLKSGKLPFGGKERLIPICKSSKREYFIISPKNLNENYIYKKLADFKSPLSNSISPELKVNPKIDNGGNVKVKLKKEKVMVGETVGVSVLTDEDYKIFSKLKIEDKHIEASKVGKFDILIITEGGQLEKRELKVVDNMKSKLENISFPKNITCGGNGTISLRLKNLGKRTTLPINFNTKEDVTIKNLNVSLNENQEKNIKTGISIDENCESGERLIHFRISDKYYNKKLNLIERHNNRNQKGEKTLFEKLYSILLEINDFF